MIDNEATLEEYGYPAIGLAPKSNKRVVAVCDDCGAIRYPKKCDYRALCIKCVKKTDSFVDKQRAGKIGKKHTEEHKQNIRNAAPRGEPHANWKGGEIVLVCKQCGKEYSHRADNADGSSFCSIKCKAMWQSENLSGENAFAWTGGKTVGVCAECGKEFSAYYHENQVCCSVECTHKYISGENHHCWQGGISFLPYCPKFDDGFKEGIREKYGRVCFVCGKTESRNGQRMSVHHTNYLKECLCVDIKCEFVPLCVQCHTRTNGNRVFWERLFMYSIGYYEEYYNVEIPKGLLCLNI